MRPRPSLALLVALALLPGCGRRDDGAVLEPLGPMEKPYAALEPLWPVPGFALTERSGAPVSLADLKGKIWVADFFYTTCPGPCPLMTSRLSEVHRALRDEPDVRVVSITVDPEKDTPEMLRAYAGQFGASDRWLFLTGDKAGIYALANQGFKLSVVPAGEGEAQKLVTDGPIVHSSKLALVNRDGAVCALYEGTSPDETQRLIGDIRKLLARRP